MRLTVRDVKIVRGQIIPHHPLKLCKGGGVECFSSEYSEIDFLECGRDVKKAVSGGVTQPFLGFVEFWLRG